MWGRVPLPHTYVNIPMGCVYTARKSLPDYAVPQYRTTRKSLADYAVPQYRTTRKSLADYAVPQCRTMRKSLADYAVPQCRTTRKPLMGLHRFPPGIGTIPKKIPNMGLHRFRRGCGGWISGRRRLTAIKRAT